MVVLLDCWVAFKLFKIKPFSTKYLMGIVTVTGLQEVGEKVPCVGKLSGV